MKRILVLLFCFISTIAFANDEKELNVYNWANYLPDEVIKQFQDETGIKINYSTFDSNETLYAKLKSNPQAGYDVVVPSTYLVDRMRRENMLFPLNKTLLPNFKNLNPHLLNQIYDPGNQVSVPYLWGTTSIVVNTRYHKINTIQRWEDFWSPQYRDQLLLIDDVRDVFAVALKTLGYSVNEKDPQHIEQAYQKLKNLMPNVRLFNAEALQTLYIDEDVTIGMGLSGDIYIANNEDSTIQYVYPKEGAIYWLDSLVIPRGAKHVENAHRFINFVLRPDVAAKISSGIGYATPNLVAFNHLPPKVRNNRIIYPTASDLAHAEFQADVGNDANRLYQRYWELLKIGG